MLGCDRKAIEKVAAENKRVAISELRRLADRLKRERLNAIRIEAELVFKRRKPGLSALADFFRPWEGFRSVEWAAERLGLSRAAVLRLIHDEVLFSHRTVRGAPLVSREEVEAYERVLRAKEQPRRSAFDAMKPKGSPVIRRRAERNSDLLKAA